MATAPRKPRATPTKTPSKRAATKTTTKRTTSGAARDTRDDTKPLPITKRGWVKLGSEFDFDASPRTPLEAAQDLMFEAWKTHDPKRRVLLAREAVRLSPDCADAYSLLARSATATPQGAVEMFRKGVEAGERAIGSREEFDGTVGHFWGVLETRPYMRARTGLAEVLWEIGHRDEAVAHYQELLRLNPNDNQGLRYRCTTWLIELDRDADAKALLTHYDEGDSCFSAYPAALLAFRADGDAVKARAALKVAVASNPYVPGLLLGATRMPTEAPGYMGIGDESEAVSYVLIAASTWRTSKGAIDWLRSRIP